MSEYGPAIFCARVDGAALSENEQEELEKLVNAACATLRIVDDMDGEPATAEKYDYDEYEEGAVSFVLWANYAYGSAPEDVQEDFDANAKGLSEKIAKQINAAHPGVYRLDGYYVEV